MNLRHGSAACIAAGSALLLAAAAPGSVTVDYDAPVLGSMDLGGLSAAATWSISGQSLMVTVQNTSSGAPFGAETTDALVVSLAFDLGNIMIAGGNAAVIGDGSFGLGMWSDRGAGDSVGEQWIWTNDGGGDQLGFFPQVLSTSNGQGGGDVMSFDGISDANVQGPWGGIAANPVFGEVPDSQFAVSNSITFSLDLSQSIDEAMLQMIAESAVIEFGSDFRYAGVPAPGALGLLALAALGGRRRRGN